jgi:predicted secreted protein
MGIGTAVAIYFLIWWVLLFAVLPWGVRSQVESGEVSAGTEPGAPARHRIGRTLLWTTILASIVFAVLWAIYAAGLIPVDLLMAISGPPRRY